MIYKVSIKKLYHIKGVICMSTLFVFVFIGFCISIWYFSKKKPDKRMRNFMIVGAVLSFIVVGVIAPTEAETELEAEETTNTTDESSSESSVEEVIFLINSPAYSLKDGTFTVTGDVNPNVKVSFFINDVEEGNTNADSDGSFSYTGLIPETEDITYVVKTETNHQTIKIISRVSLEKLEAEKEAEQKEKERIEAEEQKKAEEEAAKKAEEERVTNEKKKAEEEKERKIEEETNKKEQEIANASREQRNALSKANDYLDYTAFSMSGLYEQLLFESFPEDAAQFAIDNIVVDWNAQALQKAIDYLDYTSFSDQSLYEQLIFEGFTSEQAQYAIDNLPQ